MTRCKSLKRRVAQAGHTGDGLLSRTAARMVLVAGLFLLHRVGVERKQQSDNA